MSQTTHKCPITDCPIKVPRHVLMCRGHWRMVPKDLARDVYREWGIGMSDDYWSARAATISAVEAQIAEAAGSMGV